MPEFLGADGLGLLISNKIYEPSYISTEYVMSQHSLIPEAVFSCLPAGDQCFVIDESHCINAKGKSQGHVRL